MNKVNYQKEIEEKISEAKSQIVELNEKIKSYDDELSGVISDEEEVLLKESIGDSENKIRYLENFIFDLKLKKHQFGASIDESDRQYNIARNSIFVSGVLTLILLYLTLQQINLLKDQIVLGAVESIYAHTELSNEYNLLKNICEPIINEKSDYELQKQFAQIDAQVKESANKHQSAIKHLEGLINKELKEVQHKVHKLETELGK